MNSRGFTALSLLAHGESAGRTSEIKVSIPQTLENHDPPGRPVYANNTVAAFHPFVGEEIERERKKKWQNSMYKMLMVVETLPATMAFPASITLPGGLWQDDFAGDDNGTAPHTAGKYMMADKYPLDYKCFVTFNTMSFVASPSIIMHLLRGLPLKWRQITAWIAMLTMWVAITFTAATYAISIFILTPPSKLKTFSDAIRGAMRAWVGLMVVLFLCDVVCLILKLVRKILKFVRKASIERRPDLQMSVSQKKRPEP